MGWVSKERIARARQIPALDFVLSFESGNLMPVGRGYRLKEHPSVAINENGWYWHSREIGGKTALDYLVHVRGYGLTDAVSLLTGEKPVERNTVPQAEPAPDRKPFALPIRNGNNERVIGYLLSRGIDERIIGDCIARGVLYESKQYHNAVFVGRDERGKARFAAMRGTLGAYKCDADGSDKSYGFILPPAAQGNTAVAVFESPIDALSHHTLCEHGFLPAFDGWRLSLGGTSPLALERFRETHPQVTRCLICTDNDEAGDRAAKIIEISGLSSARAPPPLGKDWNETLQITLRNQRTQNRARQAPGFSR